MNVATPSFLYFDLGKVLVDFEIQRMLAQMGRVAGVEPERMCEIVFDGGLQHQYETGRISREAFFEAVCDRTGTRPALDALERAGCEIFWLNVDIVPVVAALRAAGYRMGVLSNTCRSHWEHCRRRFQIVDGLFDVFALSYQIGHAKPEPAIFAAAAELAGTTPSRIFFVDDLAANVEAAQAAGFDAVRYTSTPELVAALRQRGLRFGY